MRAAYDKYQDQGFEVLSISVREDDAPVADFVARYGLTYPFLMDRSGSTSVDYGVATTPTTYFISPDGELVDSLPGVVSQRWLEGNITQFLES